MKRLPLFLLLSLVLFGIYLSLSFREGEECFIGHHHHVVDWLFFRLNPLIDEGRDADVVALWDRIRELEPDIIPNDYRAWNIALAYRNLQRHDKAIAIYKPHAMPHLLTLEERAQWGERLIFGQNGGSAIAGAIGKAQCPLCHGFLPDTLSERAPNMRGVYQLATQRLRDPKYHLGHPQDRDTVKKEACPGCGTAANEMEYLAESIACPNCYIVAGFGLRGTHDTDGGCPVIHKSPIALTIDEMIAVETWIMKQEGVELPVEVMRAAHEKFIPPDERPGSFEPMKLASLYEAGGHREEALDLLDANYAGVVTHDLGLWMWHGNNLEQWRDDPAMFAKFKTDPVLVEKYPVLLKVDERPLRQLTAETIGVEYDYHLEFGGEFPRWSPDGHFLLYTQCDDQKACSLRIYDWRRSSRRTLVEDGNFGDWSPDGTRIAYLTGKQIRLFELSGQTSLALGDLPREALTTPLWMANGSGLVVLEKRTDQNGCQEAVLDIATRTWTRRKIDVGAYRKLTQQVTERLAYGFEAFEDWASSCDQQSKSIKADEPSVMRFIRKPSTSSIFRPSWIPVKNHRLIWAMSTGGSFATLLARDGYRPVLSADGRWLAYQQHVEVSVKPVHHILKGIIIARLVPFPSRDRIFQLPIGKSKGLSNGMLLLVRRPQADPQYTPPPIGAVVVERLDSNSVIVRTGIDTYQPNTTYTPAEKAPNPFREGAVATLPRSKRSFALQPLSSPAPVENTGLGDGGSRIKK